MRKMTDGSLGLGRRASTLWILWLAGAIAATLPLGIWHVQYFRHPGARFLPLLLLALGISAAAVPLYHKLRQRGLWRYEPAILTALPLAAALIYQMRATGVALWVFLSAFAAGHFVLRRVRLNTENPLEEMTLAAGIGLGVLACAGFGLGLAGGYHAWAVAALLAGVCLVFRREIPALGSTCRRIHLSWAENSEVRSGLGTLLVVFAVVFTICGTMVMLAPSLAFDVLRYHLAEVEAYSAQHALRVLPFNDFCYYPQNVEVIMTLGYSLGGQAAAQMAPPLFFILTLLLVYLLARRCGATRLGGLAGMVFAGTLPFTHWTGSVAKNDLALAFYVLAALYAYLRWEESANFSWIGLGVFFFAMGAGVKLVAVYAAPALALLYGRAVWKQPGRVKALAGLAAVFAVCGLFWPARTYVLTGNPVYPWSMGRAVSGHTPAARSGWRVLEYLQLPWNIQFHGQRYFESLLPNPLGVIFVLFVPVWLMVRQKRAYRAERVCLLFAAMYLLYWSSSVNTLRFAIAPVALLAALTGSRLAALYHSAGPWLKGFQLGASAYALLVALLAAMIVEINAPQFRLFAGKLDRAGYLREALVTYPSLDYLNTHASPGERVLGVMNCSAAYAPDPASFDCIYPLSEVVDWHAVAQRVEGDHFRFVVAPSGSAEKWIAPGAEKIYRDPAFSVYRIRETQAKQIKD
ncbi:MAG TPA: glycosyltransferase family 39 protein [Bryobacteraceae bacterium]|nr:glycosyltransferase family 39 protein [Bryobacteraceae bacterium]